MSLARNGLLLLLSIAAAQGDDKDKPKFSPGPIADYPNRQTIGKVMVAARAYTTDEQVKPAFGKLNPYQHGVLPVLVLIENGTGQTLSLDRMKVELIASDRRRFEATPANEVRFISGPNRPGTGVPGPIPGGKPRFSKKKNPLDAWEIEGRAFAARMLPNGETASGFFYFQAPSRNGSVLYLTGIRESASGKELFYFEVPLDEVK